MNFLMRIRNTISYLCLLVVCVFLFSCSETDRNNTTGSTSPNQQKAPQCIVWSKNDSLVMGFVHTAIPYVQNNDVRKALVYYKHVCTMPHELPGIFLYTGILFEQLGDTLEANRYYQLEEIHDLKILASKLPPCRKSEFRKTLYETELLLKAIKNHKRYPVVTQASIHL